MLYFIVCDDNSSHNQNLEKRLGIILKSVGGKGMIALITEKGEDVLRYAQKNTDKTNVYLLDINLKEELTGVDIARKIREIDKRAYFIFISAYQEYSLLSLKTKAFDFLVKPINLEVLEKCIKLLIEDYLASKKKEILTIKTGSTVYNINIATILFLEKYRQVLVIHTSSEIIQCHDSLRKMEDILLPHGFFRCHKSYLVNTGRIKRVDRQRNLIVMDSGNICHLSRTFKKEFLNKLIADIGN